MKHPGLSAENNSLSARAPDARREAVVFLRRKRPWESDGSPVRNAGSFSGNILRSMDGKSRGPAGVWAAHVSSGRGVGLISCEACGKPAGVYATAPAPVLPLLSEILRLQSAISCTQCRFVRDITRRIKSYFY